MEGGILWNDTELGIDWDGIFKKYGITKPVLSDKDTNRITLSQLDTSFYRSSKRYLVTGSKGQLGYDIARELIARGETDILAIDKDEMDITDSEQVMKVVKEFNWDTISKIFSPSKIYTSIPFATGISTLITVVSSSPHFL